MNIVGITSCTCGIEHTYMAIEKLLETGEKFGWSVKIFFFKQKTAYDVHR